MDSLDQLTDFEFLLEQVRHVKNDRNVPIQDQAEYFHKTLVDQIESFSEIEKKHLYRYLKLSRDNEELQASYDELNESFSQELRKVERKNAELQDAKAALREAQKDCEAKEEYIRDAEAANAALKEKNQEQRSLIKSYKQDWKAMKDELELRDRTIDDLQTSLRSKGALVDKYERDIEQYRNQRKEWERQVDEAAQYLDDKSEVLKWLNEVSRPLKGTPKIPSSEASSSGIRKVSESVVGSTTDGGADDETRCTTDSGKGDKATSATGSCRDRRPDLQESAMDCSSEGFSVDETKSTCGATLDEEMMYLSDSLSALSIKQEASSTECHMTGCHEISSPASSYDLDLLPQRRKRRRQRTKEVEGTELTRKRTKVRKQCESPVQTDSGESASFDAQDRKQGSAEYCASPIQRDGEANPLFDVEASDQGPPETPCPIDCMKTADTIFAVSRGVQTVACQMDGPVTTSSIESPEASGGSQALLLNGRRGRYRDPVYLPKSYAKSQRLTHQARELCVSRPRYVSVTRPVLRSRVASWPLHDAEQPSFEQDDLQQENIETLLVSPSSNHGGESLEAEYDADPVLQTVSHEPHTAMGGKWWLRSVTMLVLLLSIFSILSPDGERRSWNEVNMMPHDSLTKLRKCPHARCKVTQAAEWEIVRRTDSDSLSFG